MAFSPIKYGRHSLRLTYSLIEIKHIIITYYHANERTVRRSLTRIVTKIFIIIYIYNNKNSKGGFYTREFLFVRSFVRFLLSFVY